MRALQIRIKGRNKIFKPLKEESEMKREETGKILAIFLALSFVLLFGGIANAAITNGCPENYYDAEKGCQIAVDTEYIADEAEAIDLAVRVGCDANFFEPEKGCQITTTEYVQEYALANEVIGEEAAIGGCPINFFDAEKGCQLQDIR